MLTHYSISNLKLHSTNPRRWALTYLEKWKEPASVALTFGSDVHSYIEYLLRGRRGVIPTALSDTDKGVLNNWYRQFAPIGDIHIENKFSVMLLNNTPPLIGIVDLWYKNPLSGLHIFDHKTCKGPYCLTAPQLLTDWQLNMYAYALNLGKEDVTIYHNQFVKNTANSIKSWNIQKNILTKNNISGIIKDIRTEIGKAEVSIQQYKKDGIEALPETPQHRRWYGKLDNWWPVISGEVDIDDYNKYLKSRGELL